MQFLTVTKHSRCM